ncbi:probable cytochrome P450 9f2 [Cimex lectularius]|uniref:Cytochrome P450 n=1 Tax=Cimex lectularius TaxID=79782 RepID=A0A8I6SPY4_CIMLE|nr:probable cytochrome P450 9f2 [Cimex lectularius]
MLSAGLALVCILVGTVWLWLKPRFSYWRRKGVKEWEATSIFGHYRNVVALRGNEVDECYKKLGDVKFGGYYFLWKPLLMVKDEDLIKKITVKDFDHFTDHPPFLDVNNDTDAVLRSLFFLNGAEWKTKRAAMSHFFTPRRLKILPGSVEKLCTDLFPKFDRLAESKEDFEIENQTAEISMNIITTTFIGVDVKDQTFFRSAVKLFSEPGMANVYKFILYNVHHAVHKILRLTTLDKEIHPIFADLVDKVITKRLEQNIAAEDLFDYLIKCKNGEIKQFEGKRNIAYCTQLL